MQLSSNTKIIPAFTVAEGAAGQTLITGATIDTQGFDSALLIVPVGPITAGGVQSLKLQHDDASGMGTAADITGSNQAIADDDDNTTRYVDVARIRKRYLRVLVSRATQNSTFGGATWLLYNAAVSPVVHDDAVSGEQIVTPISGTA